VSGARYDARCAAFAGDPGDQRLELFLLVLAPGQYQVGEFVEDKDQERQIGLSCFDAFKVCDSNL
jgi:hypothetical protein